MSHAHAVGAHLAVGAAKNANRTLLSIKRAPYMVIVLAGSRAVPRPEDEWQWMDGCVYRHRPKQNTKNALNSGAAYPFNFHRGSGREKRQC